jgi:signal transduction histidine kinase/ActR/RegA family two-component response regulator
MTGRGATLELIAALSNASRRAEAARALGARLGCEDLLLFVRDPELRVLLPAPGFPATLHGGPSWRAFIAECLEPGRHQAQVELPGGRWRRAMALVPDGMAVVLLDGEPKEHELALLETVMPLLSMALHAEQHAAFESAQAADARSLASRTNALADALEAARAEGAKLNAELREEQRRKDDFLAMLGHELRNPLTPLVTSIELLRRMGPGPPGTERTLEVMARQTRQLSRLVEDLLDVSRVSRGRIELRRERLTLRDLVEDALEANRPLLESRRHRVRVHGADEPLTVNGDRARLTQVFSNLVHNAAKYTDPDGAIEVRLESEAGWADVHIADNGIGIAGDMQARVFDLFTQAPVSLARAQGGLGIGLTLVRSLVDLHGGRVEVKSGGLGQGSTFTVRLPLAEARADAPAEESPQAPHRPCRERALRVLVVDDNEDAADSLAEVLRTMGCDADVAYSGTVALQLAGDLGFDMVLLDIGLPQLDGYEVARRLRRVGNRDALLVAVTGYGMEEDRRRSREVGFDEHLVKPVPIDTLARLAERAAERAAAVSD